MNCSDKRLPESTLKIGHLKLFHRILTRYESNVQPKAVKDFRSCEIKYLMHKYKTSKSKKLYLDEPLDSDIPLRLSELRFNSNGSKASELISNLRHAFAHNRIYIESEDDNILKIENIYKNKIKMVGRVKFDILKELIDTILGDHNMSDKQKKKVRKKLKTNN